MTDRQDIRIRALERRVAQLEIDRAQRITRSRLAEAAMRAGHTSPAQAPERGRLVWLKHWWFKKG